MAYSFKVNISFGLVFIPVTLHSAVKPNSSDFRLLDKKTMSKVRYLKTCDECEGRTLDQKDIVKAFEYEKGRYVVFSDEDFEKIKTPKDKNITIEKFVDAAEIDPIFFDKPYFVAPEGSDRAFAVLLAAMEKKNKAGIAKCVLGNRETLIALRAKNGEMLLNTLYFFEEVKKNPAKVTERASEKEISLAVTVIDAMSGAFDPAEFRDEYTAKVKKAIDDKISGKEIKTTKVKGPEKIVDLVEALKQSVLLSKTPKKESKSTVVVKSTPKNGRKAKKNA